MRRAVAVTLAAVTLLAMAALAGHWYLAAAVRDRLDVDLAAAIPGTHLVHDGIEVGAFAANAAMAAPRIHRDNRQQPVMQATALNLTRQSTLWAWLNDGRLAVSVELEGVTQDRAWLRERGLPPTQLAVLDHLGLLGGDGGVRTAFDYRPADGRLEATLDYARGNDPTAAGLRMELGGVGNDDIAALASRRMPIVASRRYATRYADGATQRAVTRLARAARLDAATTLQALLLPVPLTEIARRVRRATGLEFERLRVAPLLSAVTLASVNGHAPNGIPFRAQSLELSEVALARVGGRLVPVTGVARLRGAHSELDGWPTALAEPLARAGHTEVRFDGRAAFRFEPREQHLVVPRARLALNGMGELTAGLTLTGLTAGALAGRPAALVSAAVDSGRLTYRDDGLVPRLLASEARAAGVPLSRYRRRLTNAVSVWLDQRLGEAAGPIAEAVGAFLREPGLLHARLRPEAPVPTRAFVLAAALGRWGALAGQLGLTVEAQAASQASGRDGGMPRPRADATAAPP